jgi:hypothetical protein
VRLNPTVSGPELGAFGGRTLMEDVFFSRNRIFKLGPIRGVYFVTFAAFFILTEIGREFYRPYAYQNEINDFGLADVIGNLLGTVAIIFFCLGVNHANRVQSIRVTAFVTVGVTIYELLQAVLPKGVLDWKDVVSTPIAGLFSLMLVLVIWRVVRDPLAPSEEKVDT